MIDSLPYNDEVGIVGFDMSLKKNNLGSALICYFTPIVIHRGL